MNYRSSLYLDSKVGARNFMIEIKLLADCPENYIPQLAELWKEEIGRIWAPALNIENIIQRFMQHVNKDMLPIMYVAVDNNTPIAMACLRVTEGIMPELTPWLGGLVVAPKYRKSHVMSSLVKCCISKAKHFGHSNIYIVAFDKNLAKKYHRIMNCEVIGNEYINEKPVSVMRFKVE